MAAESSPTVGEVFEAGMEDNNMETDAIPQTQPLDSNQVPNSAGGYSYKVDDMVRLRRFLCLGSEGGTYYISEKKLGKENAQCIQRMIEQGKGDAVLEEIVKYSTEGRAAKQNPTLFALALCARQDKDVKTKRATYKKLADVCRIPTHLFAFIDYAEALSRGTGWGRAHRKGVCNWYNRFKKDPKRLAMHVTKYKNRNGWTHTDVLRLAHPKPASEGVGAVIKYVIKGFDVAKQDLKEDSEESLKKTMEFLQAVEEAKKVEDPEKMIQLIHSHGLVREHIPTTLLNDKIVWRALLNNMPMTAMIRNLGKMTSIGLLEKGTVEALAISERLTNEARLKEAKVHPFNVLLALKTYQQGHGEKGKLKWEKNDDIVEALEQAYYLSFKFVEPTNKRYLLALDVSGSMGCKISNSVLQCREGAAAMSMVTARTEKHWEMVGFCDNLRPLKVKAEHTLDQVLEVTNNLPFGGTDCALPMVWAKQKKKEFDVFVVYTDCETYFGKVHPTEALRQYRQATGIWDAKLIVVGMSSNEFTIADPEDPGMFDMVGFDSAGPEVMRQFIMGQL